MKTLPQAVVRQIIKARDAARSEFDRLNLIVSTLNGGGHASYPKRVLSKDARERIAAAQRERWAKTRAKTKGKANTSKPVVKGAASHIANVANAQKSYWARFSPEQRKKEMARRMKVREAKAKAGK